MTQEFINNLADKLQKVGSIHAIGETWISIDSTIPAGGVPFLGQLVNRSVWADLFAWATSQGKVKTESEWQSYASANGGNCPFYSDGDGSTTFRMPCIKGYMKGADTLLDAGSYTAEGLPNILGRFMAVGNGASGYGISIGETSGAFSTYVTGRGDGYTNNGNSNANLGCDFNASRSDPIYGTSDHVTPETHSILIGVYAVGIVANIGSADATQFLNGLTTVEAKLSKVVTSINGVAADASGNVSEVEESDVANPKLRWIRYTNGIQICFGHHVHDAYVSLPKPFKDNTFVINGALCRQASDGATGIRNAIVGAFMEKTSTSFKVLAINAMENDWDRGTPISWIAIGLWK